MYNYGVWCVSFLLLTEHTKAKYGSQLSGEIRVEEAALKVLLFNLQATNLKLKCVIFVTLDVTKRTVKNCYGHDIQHLSGTHTHLTSCSSHQK